MCEHPLFLCKQNSNSPGNSEDFDKNLFSALESIGYKKVSLDELVIDLDKRSSQSLEHDKKNDDRIDIDDELQKLSKRDKEIQLRIMGYVHIFAPISRNLLIERLSTKGHSEELSENCINKMVLENIISNVGGSYIPRNKRLCEEAYKNIADEILPMLEEC